jgi:hypothetical protein
VNHVAESGMRLGPADKGQAAAQRNLLFSRIL